MNTVTLGPTRTLLFVPADNPLRVQKAAQLPTDVVVLELEDGVAPGRKEEARAQAGGTLASVDFGRRSVAVRINRLATANGLRDLLALIEWTKKPRLLILPKVGSASEVRLYEELLAGIAEHTLLLPSIEDGKGLAAAVAIAGASPRVVGLLFGGGDLSLDIGCRFDWETLLPYRAQVVAAAAAAGVVAIDVPFVDVRDEQGLRREAEAARRIGMGGKVCIHPAQLQAVNEAFRPSTDEVERAKRIVAAAGSSSGATLVDGRMIDAPMVRVAQRTLAAAEALAGQ